MDFKGMFFFLFFYGYCPHPDPPTQIWINPCIFFLLNPSLSYYHYEKCYIHTIGLTTPTNIKIDILKPIVKLTFLTGLSWQCILESSIYYFTAQTAFF